MLAKTLLLALSFCGMLLASTAHSPRPLPHHWDRGTVFFALEPHAFNNTVSGVFSTLQSAQQQLTGLDFIALQFMWAQQNATSSAVYAQSATPTDDELVSIVSYIKNELQLKVLLKPLVVGEDGALMSEINPANRTEWFLSYRRMFRKLMSLVGEAVDMVSIGLELSHLAEASEWSAVIQDVRSLRAPGSSANLTVTYCSNPLVGETQMFAHWEELDVVGIDLNIPYIISRSANATLPAVMPSRQKMREVYWYLWDHHVMNWYELMRVNNSTFPKLFITESGYPSCNMGLQSPWMMPEAGCVGSSGVGNFTAQAVAFDVQFEMLTVAAVAPYIAGFTQFWFGEQGTSDYYPNRFSNRSKWECGWTPAGKEPTLQVLRSAYNRSSLS